MFKTFGTDDIIRNQGTLPLNPSYTHIEQYTASDVVCASDLGRPIRNLFENEAEMYMFLNSLSREVYQRPGVYPNSLGSAFTFNSTRDFKKVTIVGDTDKYYVRLSPGIAGFEHTSFYDKGFICISKPMRGLCERQIAKALNLVSKDDSEYVSIKYDYTNAKYKMRIVKSEPDGTLYTYDFINDATSFDSDVDGKGYDTAIDLLAAMYTNSTLRNALTVYQNRLDILQLEPIFYIPSAGTYYIKIDSTGKFICNTTAPTATEFGLWSFVISGTTELTIGTITDLRVMYTNGVHYVNTIRIYPLAESDDYASIYGESNGTNTIVHHQIGRDATDKFVVEVNNGTTVSTIFEVSGDRAAHFTGSLNVDGNVVLGDSGSDTLTIRGDTTVLADDGSTPKVTIDNNTGNTNIEGTLGVTGSITARDSVTLGTTFTDTLSINSTVNTDINFNDSDRVFKIGGAGGSSTTRTFLFQNVGFGSAKMYVEGEIKTGDGVLATSNPTSYVFNDTATSISFAGAATTLNIANTATAAQTINVGTAVTGVQTINIGTSVDTNTAQNVNFGKLTNTVSTITVNPVTTSTTYSTGALVVRGGVGIGGALNVYGNVGFTNALTVGGVTTLNGNTIIGDTSTDTISLNGTISTNILVDDNNRSMTIGLSATNTNRTFTIINGSTTKKVDMLLDGDLTLGKSTSSTTTQIIANTGVTTANVFNTVATTLNIGGAATTISIGAATGILTINNANTVVTGDLGVNGGDLTSSVANFNLINTSTGTINFGGASSVINISKSGSTTNILGTLTVTGTTMFNGDVTFGDAGTDASTFKSDVIVKADDGATSTFTIDNNTGNTSASGTLGVTGIATFSNNVNINGASVNSSTATFNLFATPTTMTFGSGATTINVGNSTNASVVSFKGTTVSSSSTTGAVTIDGGLGVAGNANIGGNAAITGTLTVTGATTINGNATVGDAAASDTLTLNTTLQSNIVFNDADRVIYVGGSAGSATNRTLSITNAGTGLVSLLIEGDLAVNDGDITTASTAASVFNTTATTLNIGGAATTISIGAATGTLTVNNATLSAPNITALTVGTDNATARTASIHANTTIGTTTNNKTLTIYGATTTNGILKTTNTTAATSAATGSLVAAGGAGIGGNLYVGGSTYITGNLQVDGTTYTVNSTVMTVDDPIITLGGDTAPTSDDNKDRGVEFRWYDTNTTSAKSGFFGFDDSTTEFIAAHNVTNTSEVMAVTDYSTVRAYGFVANNNSLILRNTTTNINNLTITNGYTAGSTASSLALNMQAGARTLTMSGNLTLSADCTISALTSGYVVIASGTNTIGAEQYLSTARGGLGTGTMTQYAVATGGASAVNYVSPSTADYVLSSNGASAQPSFRQVSLTSGVTGTLPTGNGGTGNTSFTGSRLIYSSSATALSSSSITSNGSNLGGITSIDTSSYIKALNTGGSYAGIGCYSWGSDVYSPSITLATNNGSAKHMRCNSANELDFINSTHTATIAHLNNDGYFYANRFYGAVYNDYADYIEVDERTPVEYGKAYVRNENYTVVQSSKKAQDGFIGIASDTYGQAIGLNDKVKQIPIAVGGWVLAYTDKIYSPGTPLVVSKDGKLTKASWFVQAFKSHKIIATFDRTELQKTWHDVEVKGRNWVKVR